MKSFFILTLRARPGRRLWRQKQQGIHANKFQREFRSRRRLSRGERQREGSPPRPAVCNTRSYQVRHRQDAQAVRYGQGAFREHFEFTGTIFDSSIQRGQPISFGVVSGVDRGMDRGFATDWRVGDGGTMSSRPDWPTATKSPTPAIPPGVWGSGRCWALKNGDGRWQGSGDGRASGNCPALYVSAGRFISYDYEAEAGKWRDW